MTNKMALIVGMPMGRREFMEDAMEPVFTFKTARDSRNWVVLRGKDLAEFYEVDVFPDGEIRMHPRVPG